MAALIAVGAGTTVLALDLYRIVNGIGQVGFLNFIGNLVGLGLIGADLAVAEGLPAVVANPGIPELHTTQLLIVVVAQGESIVNGVTRLGGLPIGFLGEGNIGKQFNGNFVRLAKRGFVPVAEDE